MTKISNHKYLKIKIEAIQIWVSTFRDRIKIKIHSIITLLRNLDQTTIYSNSSHNNSSSNNSSHNNNRYITKIKINFKIKLLILQIITIIKAIINHVIIFLINQSMMRIIIS